MNNKKGRQAENQYRYLQVELDHTTLLGTPFGGNGKFLGGGLFS
jgi:hypothetical protein